MKKSIVFILLFIFAVLIPRNTAKADEMGLSARAAILIEAKTGKVIFEKNSHERLPMASTTKIMTALLASEYHDLKKEFITTEEMVTVEGSSMGLKIGDTVTMEALIYGMLLSSGNDAANTVAHIVGGNVTGFLKMMNSRATEIGMYNTNFETPSGLDSDSHYSSAYDMALLAAEAMKNSVFAKAAESKSASVKFGNPPSPRTLSNHNRLLREYPGAIGVKTGFTKKSGRCLVSAAKKDNVTLIAVTLKSPSDWDDHKKLLNRGFSKLKFFEFDNSLKNIVLRVAGGDKSRLTIESTRTGAALEEKDFARVTRVIELPKFVYAPIEKGRIIGKVTYYLDGKIVAESPISAYEDVNIKPKENRGIEDFLNWFEILLDV